MAISHFYHPIRLTVITTTLMDPLSQLIERIRSSTSDQERCAILDKELKVQEWAKRETPLSTWMQKLATTGQLIVKSLIAIGQEKLFERMQICSDYEIKWQTCVDDLLDVESFYKEQGGIIGYHGLILSYLRKKGQIPSQRPHEYLRPPGIDISQKSADTMHYVLEGIASLKFLSEVYPAGGAADRLNLVDPDSKIPLPAALLTFNGVTLLEGLIRDVQAREYLYYQLFNEQVTVPIAMMTSIEKDNHNLIIEQLKQHNWFGRSSASFRFFCQPVVPTVDSSGSWCLNGDRTLLMRPGGHGVIWKVAQENGIWDWLEEQGKTKVLLRQINNPIAGIDDGLLAFCGVGFYHNKQFGFASCPREVGSAEGINVLIRDQERKYCLTSIEYCDFERFCIDDVPYQDSSGVAKYAQFPSNTNILFADIAALKETIFSHPIPGMLVNAKKMFILKDKEELVENEVVRLESTMQNLADYFVDSAPSQDAVDVLSLRTFLTYNKRHKTISAVKKLQPSDSARLETPIRCFYDLCFNHYELLKEHCQFSLPPFPELEDFVVQGPPFIFRYHPALGPLYSIISKKLRGGSISLHSYLELEIADVDIAQLTLNGALSIRAERIMGAVDTQGLLRYSKNVGRCRLKSVRVMNRGLDFADHPSLWKGNAPLHEVCEIILRGNGEFIAEDVELSSGMRIVVDNGMRTIAYRENGIVRFRNETADPEKVCCC